MLFLPKVLLQRLVDHGRIKRTPPNRLGQAAEADGLRASAKGAAGLNRFHGVENIKAVRMKSMPSTHSEEITTVRVVA